MTRDLYLEALKALIAFHKRKPDVYDEFGNYLGTRRWVQPSEFDSVVGRKYVYLNNINGLIAKYNLQTGEIII